MGILIFNLSKSDQKDNRRKMKKPPVGAVLGFGFLLGIRWLRLICPDNPLRIGRRFYPNDSPTLSGWKSRKLWIPFRADGFPWFLRNPLSPWWSWSRRLLLFSWMGNLRFSCNLKPPP